MTVKGGHHSEEAKKKISETKRQLSGRSRAPLVPQLCACGCGEYAAVDERRNRVAKYVSGHNSKVNHPMQGRHHTEEAKAKLASYTGEKGAAYRHGWARTPTYVSWRSMISRCEDERNASFSAYGARGITVCERWHVFEGFLEDVGERPSKEYQFDRRDPDLGYWCGHCAECVSKGRVCNGRWLTRAENNARRRDPGGWIRRRAKVLAEAAAQDVPARTHVDGSPCLAPDHCSRAHRDPASGQLF